LFCAGGLIIFQSASAQNLKQAIAYTENELFETASQVFHRLISEKPGDPQLYYYIGENFYASERLDSAAFYYDKGISTDANYALNYVGKGKIQLSKGNEAEAKILFEKAKTLSGSKDVNVFLKIADAYVLNEWKDMSYALDALNVAEKLDSKNTMLHLLRGNAVLIQDNDGSAALTHYEKAVALEPQSPKPHVYIGALYERGRSYDLAYQEYMAAVALDSTYAPSYRQLGELYYQYNDYKKAKDYYAKYLQLSGNSFSARVKYAKFLFLAKEYEAAIDEINAIMAIDSTLNILNRLLGYSYYEIKMYPEGLRYLEQFMANAPASNDKIIAQDYEYYGKILSATRQDSLAIIQFSQALSMDSLNLETYTNIANSYLKTRQYDAAIGMLNKKMSLTREPSLNDYFKVAQTLYNKGAANKDSISFVQADSVFNIILTKQPDLMLAHFWRARTNAGLDPETKLGLAKPHYEKVIELGSADREKNKSSLVEAHYYLAYFYYVQKDKANALLNVDQVLSLDPNSKNAKDLKTLIEKIEG